MWSKLIAQKFIWILLFLILGTVYDSKKLGANELGEEQNPMDSDQNNGLLDNSFSVPDPIPSDKKVVVKRKKKKKISSKYLWHFSGGVHGGMIVSPLPAIGISLHTRPSKRFGGTFSWENGSLNLDCSIALSLTHPLAQV